MLVFVQEFDKGHLVLADYEWWQVQPLELHMSDVIDDVVSGATHNMDQAEEA